MRVLGIPSAIHVRQAFYNISQHNHLKVRYRATWLQEKRSIVPSQQPKWIRRRQKNIWYQRKCTDARMRAFSHTVILKTRSSESPGSCAHTCVCICWCALTSVFLGCLQEGLVVYRATNVRTCKYVRSHSSAASSQKFDMSNVHVKCLRVPVLQ